MNAFDYDPHASSDSNHQSRSSERSPFVTDNSFDQDYDPSKTYSAPDASPGHTRHVRERLNSASGRSGSDKTPHLESLNPFHISNPFASHSLASHSPDLGPSFINEATEESDFEALKEGLNFALGTSNNDGKWFPVASDTKSHISHSSIKNHSPNPNNTQDLSSIGNQEFTDNIALEDLTTSQHSNNRRYSHFGTNSETSFHSPFVDPAGSAHSQSLADTDLETGVGSRSEDSPPPSPNKFSDMLARFSERIAGTGATSTAPPPEESPSKKSAHLSVKSRNNTPEPSPISGRFSYFRDDDAESYQPYDQTSIKNHTTGSSLPKPPVPNVTIVDENNATVNVDFNKVDSRDKSDGLGLFMPPPSPVDTAASIHTAASPGIIHSLLPNRSQTSLNIPTPSHRQYTDPQRMHLFGKSLKIFSPESKLRQLCHRILSRHSTNTVLLVLLLLQTALLTYRQWNPMALHGYYYSGYDWADVVLMIINFVYTIEIFAHMIAYGFIDDHAMFEELGLPYPEHDIKGLYFRMDYFGIFLKVTGLHKLIETRAKPKRKYKEPIKNQPGVGTSSDEDDHDHSNQTEGVREINLNPPSATSDSFHPIDLRQKYGDISSHHQQPKVNFEEERVFEREESDSPTEPEIEVNTLPINPPTRFNHSNTFFLSDKKKNLDRLDLKRAYIRNSWHKIDFFSMITFWISLALSIDHYDAKHHIMLFRALSCLRILRLINLTNGTSTILKSVRMAVPQLVDVSIFISFFWVFFGIIGVQSFKSSLTRHCVWTNPDDPNDTYVNSESYCGSYMGLDGHAKPYIYRNGLPSTSIKGFECPMNSQCVSGDNPYGGTVSFDNILQSMEIVFVIITANTFTDIMYYTMDTDNIGACLFFIVSIFILTVWLMNVFIAVIVTSFNTTREATREVKKSGRRGLISRILFPGTKSERALRSERYNLWKKQNPLLKWYYKLEFIFVIVIVVDLFVQCFRKNDMSDTRRHNLFRFEVGFTITLLIEIILRFALHFPNWRLFFYSKRNIFDTFLAIITSIIIIGPVKDKLGHGYYWLTVFQLMRFYRCVLATEITRGLWMKLMGNIRAIYDLALFYFILTYLVSIMIARYYEGTIPREDIDQVDFPVHTLPNAFISLYVITSTENWTEILYPLQQYSTTTSSRSFGAVFLVAWFVISNSVILNTFIAVIASTLEVSEEGKRKRQLLQFIDNMTDRLQNVDSETGLLSKFKNKLFRSKGLKDQLEKAVVNLLLSGTAVNDFLEEDMSAEQEEEDEIKNLPSSSWKRWLHVNYWRTNNFFRNPFYSTKTKDTKILRDFDPANFARNIISERNVLITRQNKFLEENPYFNRVFYLLEPRHKLRRLCQRLVKPSYGERIDGVEANRPVSEAFVVIMFLATIGLVVSACYITPLFRKSIVVHNSYIDWTFYLEVAWVVLFSIEFIIRTIADGFIFTPNAYLRSSWNFIDLIVLISLWIEFIAVLKLDGTLSKTIRGLKALRALRLLTISQTAKDNFHNTMISGFWKIINAAIISLCLLFPFAIWGLNVFNGRLGSCLDGSSTQAMCYNEFKGSVYNWNVMSPNTFTEPYLEFNKFSTSFLSLFSIVSLEGWVDLLLNVIASTGVGTPPEDNATPFNGFFVVLFNFISTIFILTLFVSVIISNYSKTTGRAYMTDDQISWYQVRKILIQVKPSKRKDFNELGFFRRFCYKMTVERNLWWSRFLNVVLFMHVLSLLLECFPTYDGLNAFRASIYMFAATIFLLNSLMLMSAQGWKTFIHYKWNFFALFVSVGAFVTTIIGFFMNQDSVFININKLFLVGILAFIIPRSNRLSQLLRFASASLPALLSLSFTWVVIFLVYAIAMNQIFGLTKIGPNGSGNLNLRSVPKALIVLFRSSFGEGWNYVMADYTLESPYCTKGTTLDDSDCGNKAFSYILFISWNIISMYIFVNMFVSLILDSFSYVSTKSNYNQLIQREEIRKFKRVWQQFDSRGTGYIKPIELPKLLHKLDGALSFHFYKGELEIPVLCSQWFRRNDPKNPYDISVNYDAIQETLDDMDIPKIRERRKAYERFIEEALLNMELNSDPGISFTRILLQLPLYTNFEAGQCLNLIDFLERRLLVQKVEKRLQTKRVYETIAAFACRWNYMKNKNHGIRSTDIAFDSRMKRYSYLANENLEVNAPSIFVTDTNDEPETGSSNLGPNHYFDEDVSEKSPLNGSFDIEDEASTSGVYVPKSPLNIYTSRNRLGSGNHLDAPRGSGSSGSDRQPKLFIEIPNKSRSPDSSPAISAATFDDDDIHVSPFLAQADLASHESEHNVSLIDISTIGETLENSSWGEAFREVQSDNPEWNANKKDF